MDKLFGLIDKQIEKQNKVIIAIDGPSSSGKTTLGLLLEEKYNALLIHTDDYFLDSLRKTKKRLDESGGNVDYERLQKEIFDSIESEYVQSNHFNCLTNMLEERIPVKNKKVIIVEGAYSLHKTVFNKYTLKVFMNISSEKQSNRILLRNGKKMLQRFTNEWIPLEQYYFKTEDLLNRCDIIIEN